MQDFAGNCATRLVPCILTRKGETCCEHGHEINKMVEDLMPLFKGSRRRVASDPTKRERRHASARTISAGTITRCGSHCCRPMEINWMYLNKRVVRRLFLLAHLRRTRASHKPCLRSNNYRLLQRADWTMRNLLDLEDKLTKLI